ncbi:MAG: sugar phosphate isomerase/epimerase [Verrucomicrobiales bacterium]|nr:sugar phosphate isomerase/epimerase [Verrucomicrobiales bacterium]
MIFSSRRRFLCSTAAALGAPLSGHSAGPLSGRIKIAVKYHMILEPELSVKEKLEMLREVGFDGVELKVDEKIDLNEIEAASRDTGFPVHGIVNASHEDIRPAVELAHRLGCDSVLVLAREFPDLTYGENFSRWQKNVRTVLPLAEKHGIKLCIENVRATFLKTAEKMVSFIDSFESPVVRSYFDLGNTITWTEQPAEHWAEVLGERVYKLDIKDRGHSEFGEAERKRDGAVGTNGGEVHWERVRKILDRNNYSGWGTAEVPGGDRERLKRMAGWMRDVLDL